MLRIGWVVPGAGIDLASIRYRCYYPAYGLATRGHLSSMFDTAAAAVSALDRLDVLVIVKRLDVGMIGLAAKAREAGVSVVVDLCDDVISPGYRGDAPDLNLMVLAAIAATADLIVTTGEALSERVRNSLPLWAPIVEIPDTCETLELLSAVEAHFEIRRPPEQAVTKSTPLAERMRWLRSALQHAVRHPVWAARRSVGTILRLRATMRLRQHLGRISHIIRNPSWLLARGRRLWRRSPTIARWRTWAGRAAYELTHPSRTARRVSRSPAAHSLRRFSGRTRYRIAHPIWALRKMAHGSARWPLTMAALGTLRVLHHPVATSAKTAKRFRRSAFTIRMRTALGRARWYVRHPKSARGRLVTTIAQSWPLGPLRAAWRALKGTQRMPRNDALVVKENAGTPRRDEPIGLLCRDYATSAPKKIVWFGNHGGPHSNFGMLSLLAIAPELRRACVGHNVELVVISNDKAKFDSISAHLGVPTRYIAWTMQAVHRELVGASCALLTSGDDRFSRVKSANRMLLALGAGVPVVAPGNAGLSHLRGAVATEAEAGLRRYLSDADAAAADVVSAKQVIDANFSIDVVATRWEAALEDVRRRESRRRDRRMEHPRLIFLLDLIQDLNILLPVLDAARMRGLTCSVLISEQAARTAPRTIAALGERRIVPTMITVRDLNRLDARWLRASDILVTAAESSLPPHKIAFALAQLANRLGLRTASIQHGYETPGLTMAHSPPIEIASQVIFTWQQRDRLPPGGSDDVLRRCVGVGRPKLAPASDHCFDSRPGVVGVFENLHWERYSGDYRRGFLDHLLGAAEERPELTFLVRPHPAGRWFVDKAPTIAMPNIHVLGPPDPGGLPPVEHFLNRVSAVITTPSTVAADACEAGLPTAVVGGDVDDLTAYDPLPLLRSQDDWLTFLDFKDEALHAQRRDDFLKRATLPGDSSDVIVEHLCAPTWPPLPASGGGGVQAYEAKLARDLTAHRANSPIPS